MKNTHLKHCDEYSYHIKHFFFFFGDAIFMFMSIFSSKTLLWNYKKK